MSLNQVTAGENLPREINVIVEIPMHGAPVKYEVDKESGALFVDRFMSTPMHYPCDYGYVPQTLSADGDPVDVLVISPIALQPGVVVRCRPIGLMRMVDENGEDAKVLAVPLDKLTRMYESVKGPEDLPASLLDKIKHFFAHYKDLEPGKFVRIGSFEGMTAAEQEILQSAANYHHGTEN
jgi:inorganic pyrophosphatase